MTFSPLVKVVVKRFKGTDETKPMFKAYDKSGALMFQEEIGGKSDVQPAFLRVQNKLKAQCGVEELFSIGRDNGKHLQWSSINPKEPPAPTKAQ